MKFRAPAAHVSGGVIVIRDSLTVTHIYNILAVLYKIIASGYLLF